MTAQAVGIPQCLFTQIIALAQREQQLLAQGVVAHACVLGHGLQPLGAKLVKAVNGRLIDALALARKNGEVDQHITEDAQAYLFDPGQHHSEDGLGALHIGQGDKQGGIAAEHKGVAVG